MSVTLKPLLRCAILTFADASNLNVLDTFLQRPQTIFYSHFTSSKKNKSIFFILSCYFKVGNSQHFVDFYQISETDLGLLQHPR